MNTPIIHLIIYNDCYSFQLNVYMGVFLCLVLVFSRLSHSFIENGWTMGMNEIRNNNNKLFKSRKVNSPHWAHSHTLSQYNSTRYLWKYNAWNWNRFDSLWMSEEKGWRNEWMNEEINNKEKSHLQHALTLVVLVARLVPNSQVYTYLWWYDVACNRAELIKAQEPEKKCQETNAKRTSG